MIQRLQKPHGSGQRTARRKAPPPPFPDGGGPQTLPTVPRAHRVAEDEATILGFPADAPDDDEEADRLEAESVAGVPETSGELLVLRRPDRVAAAVLVLAGVAANVGLFLPWSPGEGSYGLALVQQGVDVLGGGIGELIRSGLWQPFAVVLAGGLFVILGLLMLVPAHSHRMLGVMALFVALGAAAAVVVLFSSAGWRVDRTEIGMWFAVAVPGLGLLGALKAMLTPPHVALAHPVEPAAEDEVGQS
jgi:hypothetical protein